MAIKRTHDSEAPYYCCTFTCYQWLPLFEQTNSYDAVYKGFAYLRQKQVEVVAYTIIKRLTTGSCRLNASSGSSLSLLLISHLHYPVSSHLSWVSSQAFRDKKEVE